MSLACFLAFTAGRNAVAAGYFSGADDPVSVKGSYKRTMGSQHYDGTYAYGDFGKAWRLKPSFSSYRSDVTSGTYKTYAGRLSHDSDTLTFGFQGGWTPKVGGYGNRFYGGDFTYTFDFDRIKVDTDASIELDRRAVRRKGFTSLDLGGGILQTVHLENVQLVNGPAGLTVPFEARQTDINANVGISFCDMTATMDLTKSSYNQDLTQIAATTAKFNALQSFDSILQGFPDMGAAVGLDFFMLPDIVPALSYTYTTFKLNQPPAHDYKAGLTVKIRPVQLDAGFERYLPGGGQASQNYVNAGLSVRF